MEKAPRKYVRKKKAAPALLSDSGLSLTELKTRSMQALMELAEQYEIENASSMRKQELIFALLQACASQNGAIYGDGVLEILPDGFGFLRSPLFLPPRSAAFPCVKAISFPARFAPQKKVNATLPCSK